MYKRQLLLLVVPLDLNRNFSLGLATSANRSNAARSARVFSPITLDSYADARALAVAHARFNVTTLACVSRSFSSRARLAFVAPVVVIISRVSRATAAVVASNRAHSASTLSSSVSSARVHRVSFGIARIRARASTSVVIARARLTDGMTTRKLVGDRDGTRGQISD